MLGTVERLTAVKAEVLGLASCLTSAQCIFFKGKKHLVSCLTFLGTKKFLISSPRAVKLFFVHRFVCSELSK